MNRIDFETQTRIDDDNNNDSWRGKMEREMNETCVSWFQFVTVIATINGFSKYWLEMFIVQLPGDSKLTIHED